MHIFVLFSYKDFTFKGYNDFAAFYTAGTIVNEGQLSRLYDLNLQLQTQKQFVATVKLKNAPLPYIHPPFEAWLFVPFARLKYPHAYIAWTITQICLLALAIFFLLPRGTRKFSYVVFLAILSMGLFPAAMALLQGQDSFLLLLVVSLCFFCWVRRCHFLSGCFLALGLFKFQLVIPIAMIFLLRRKYKFASGFAAVGLLLLMLSCRMVGWRGLINYQKYLWTLDHTPGLGVTTLGNMPNIRAILASVVPMLSSDTMIPTVALLSILGVILAARLWNGGESCEMLHFSGAFSLALVISMITSYYIYSYEMTLLLVPLIVVGEPILNRQALAGWPRRFLVLGAILLFLTPIAWFLILRTRLFCWYGCAVLVLFAGSLTCLMRRSNAFVMGRKRREA